MHGVGSSLYQESFIFQISRLLFSHYSLTVDYYLMSLQDHLSFQFSSGSTSRANQAASSGSQAITQDLELHLPVRKRARYYDGDESNSATSPDTDASGHGQHASSAGADHSSDLFDFSSRPDGASSESHLEGTPTLSPSMALSESLKEMQQRDDDQSVQKSLTTRLKRKRTCERDPTYYMEDGSCVLLIEDTLFNVSSSLTSSYLG